MPTQPCFCDPAPKLRLGGLENTGSIDFEHAFPCLVFLVHLRILQWTAVICSCSRGLRGSEGPGHSLNSHSNPKLGRELPGKESSSASPCPGEPKPESSSAGLVVSQALAAN